MEILKFFFQKIGAQKLSNKIYMLKKVEILYGNRWHRTTIAQERYLYCKLQIVLSYINNEEGLLQINKEKFNTQTVIGQKLGNS